MGIHIEDNYIKVDFTKIGELASINVTSGKIREIDEYKIIIQHSTGGFVVGQDIRDEPIESELGALSVEFTFHSINQMNIFHNILFLLRDKHELGKPMIFYVHGVDEEISVEEPTDSIKVKLHVHQIKSLEVLFAAIDFIKLEIKSK